jgi:hypothetical protein
MAQPRTNILEPTTHTNKKTSFRIQSANRVIYSNLRLVDFGISSVVGQTGQECFAFGSGAYALLKNVRLYSGNTLLDQCLDCDRIMGHHMLRGSTMDKYDLDQPLVGSSLNIRLQQVDPVDELYDTALQPLANKLLARIKLDDCLPLLKSLDYFAGWAGDLRVELEYNTDPTVVLADTGSQGAMTVSRPSLVFEDEMDDMTRESLIAEQETVPVSWFCWEREYISTLGAGLTGVRVRAFDNKMVQYAIMAVHFANGAPADQLGNGYSLEEGQQVNWVVNGMRLLPLSGMNSAARRAASAADASILGLCVPTGCNDTTEVAAADQNEFSDPLFALFGQLSYSAYELNTVINRLDLEFTLPADYEAVRSAYIWGSVMKFLTKSADGSIVVGYQAKSM